MRPISCQARRALLRLKAVANQITHLEVHLNGPIQIVRSSSRKEEWGSSPNPKMTASKL